jgi:hypothetical protein
LHAEFLRLHTPGIGLHRVGSGVLVGPEPLRQVFNDTDAEVPWLIIGASEEREFLQGSKSQMDLSRIDPVDPQQLPKDWHAWSGCRRPV